MKYWGFLKGDVFYPPPPKRRRKEESRVFSDMPLYQKRKESGGKYRSGRVNGIDETLIEGWKMR